MHKINYSTVLFVPTFPEAQALFKRNEMHLLEQTEYFFIYELIHNKKNVDTLLVVCGMGPVYARRAAEYILKHYKLKQIVLLGVCGALKENIKRPQVFVVKENKNLQNQSVDSSAEFMLRFSYAFESFPFSFLETQALSVDSVVSLADEKKILAQKHDTEVVEMEGFSIAELCQQKQVSFLHVRWLLDEFQDCLPDVSGFVDSFGRIKIPRLLFSLLKKPRLCFELIGLGSKSRFTFNAMNLFGKTFMKNIIKKTFIAILLLSFSACANHCGKKSDSKNSVLSIFPEQHQVLFMLNWKKFSTTPYSESVFKNISPDLKPFSSQLETLYVSTASRKEKKEPSSLALIEGNFEEQKIVDWLKSVAKSESKELQTLIWKGKTIYLSPKELDMGLSILNKNQIVWGSLDALKQSIEVIEDKKGSLAERKDFAALWAEHEADKLVWGAALLGSQENVPLPPQLQSVESLLFSADVLNADLNLTLNLKSKSESEAKVLLDFISNYQSLISSQADPFIKQVLSQLKLQQKQEKLFATLNVTAEQIKTFSSQAAMLAPETQPQVKTK